MQYVALVPHVGVYEMTSEARTITVPEVAKLLGLSRNGAYVAVRNGEIPSIRIGRRVVVPKLAIERLLDGGAVEPQQPPPGSKRVA